MAAWARTKIAEVDQHAKDLNGDELLDYLTEQNHQIVDHYREATRKLLAKLVMNGTELSHLDFKMDPNL